MKPYLRFSCFFVLLCGLVHAAFAAPPVHTVVTVKALCPNCGKKIVAKLSELPNVEGASLNLEKRAIYVRCTAGTSVSPRAIWETVERGGELPIRLDGPHGSFTAKPQN